MPDTPWSAEPINSLAVVALPAEGRQVAPAVRPAAVGVGDTVGVGELAGAHNHAGPAVGILRCGERRAAQVVAAALAAVDGTSPTVVPGEMNKLRTMG
jgi:hypothetical protein